jgi:hypothetical protein
MTDRELLIEARRWLYAITQRKLTVADKHDISIHVECIDAHLNAAPQENESPRSNSSTVSHNTDVGLRAAGNDEPAGAAPTPEPPRRHPDCADGCLLKEHKGYRDCIETGECHMLIAEPQTFTTDEDARWKEICAISDAIVQRDTPASALESALCGAVWRAKRWKESQPALAPGLVGAVKLVAAIFEDDRGDIDGGWLQGKATDLGVLVPVEVSGPCVDPELGACACAEYGDFPTTCYRINPEILRAADLTRLADEEREKEER